LVTEKDAEVDTQTDSSEWSIAVASLQHGIDT
jgi:hypothetical protein